MLRSRPSRLLLVLGVATIPPATGLSQSTSPRVLTSCSSCWPLSGAHPGSVMAADGSGGAYIVWVDGGSQWRLLRLQSDLTVPKPWPTSGWALSSDRLANRVHPVLAPDPGGGVYVAWVEQAVDGDMSVWLLRVRSDGRPAKGWPASGVSVASECPWIAYPALVRIGDGVAVGWIEARNSEARVRLATFDAGGRHLVGWPADGITLSASGQYGDAVELASDGRADVFASWTEMRARLS